MSSYRQIHTRMWSSDTWFSSLGPQFKLLFIYLFSNERASACGLYELPLRIISFETGLQREDVQHGFEVFSKADKAKYDPETGVVWVRNMLKFQSSSSPKLRARIQADIQAVPDCDLKREALRYLADTLRIGYHYHNDTPLSLSDPVRDSLSVFGSGSEGEGAQGDTPQSASLSTGTPADHTAGPDDGEASGQPEGARAVLQAYEGNIGAITPLAAQALQEDEREYGAEWVCAAIQEAVRSEVRNLRYVEAILARWKSSGLKSTGPKDKPPKPGSLDEVREMLADWLQEKKP